MGPKWTWMDAGRAQQGPKRFKTHSYESLKMVLLCRKPESEVLKQFGFVNFCIYSLGHFLGIALVYICTCLVLQLFSLAGEAKR